MDRQLSNTSFVSNDGSSTPVRRRMNNPYCTTNPVRLISSPIASPVTGQTPNFTASKDTNQTAMMMNNNNTNTTNNSSGVPEPLALPTSSTAQNNSSTYYNPSMNLAATTTSSSSSSSSTGVVAPPSTDNNNNNNNGYSHNPYNKKQQQGNNNTNNMNVTPALSSTTNQSSTSSDTTNSSFAGINPSAAIGSLVTATPSNNTIVNDNNNNNDGNSQQQQISSDPEELYQELIRHDSELDELARTSSGSSMLQCAIKADTRCANLLWTKFEDTLGDLMLDAHGGYVVRALIDSAPHEATLAVCNKISDDTRLAYSLCTHSLHTRRLVQSIMENHNPDFLSGVLASHCGEIARTQQGCIVMQRALDYCTEKPRAALMSNIAVNLADFAIDPFANYVVQYLLDTTPREEAIPLLWSSIHGRILELSCNKFASNVIEKFLMLADAQHQHELICELYSSETQGLCRVMQDSFGNYIVQATIARCVFSDLQYINAALRPVLEMVPYGSKIAARLDKRLHGNNYVPSSSYNNHHHQQSNYNQHQQQQQQQDQYGSVQQYGASSYNNNNNSRHHSNNNNVGGPYRSSRRSGNSSSYNNNNNNSYNNNVQQQQQQQQQQVYTSQQQQQGMMPATYYTTPSTAAW